MRRTRHRQRVAEAPAEIRGWRYPALLGTGGTGLRPVTTPRVTAAGWRVGQPPATRALPMQHRLVESDSRAASSAATSMQGLPRRSIAPRPLHWSTRWRCRSRSSIQLAAGLQAPAPLHRPTTARRAGARRGSPSSRSATAGQACRLDGQCNRRSSGAVPTSCGSLASCLAGLAAPRHRTPRQCLYGAVVTTGSGLASSASRARRRGSPRVPGSATPKLISERPAAGCPTTLTRRSYRCPDPCEELGPACITRDLKDRSAELLRLS